MSRKRYDVVINGTETTLLLNDEDAALHGLKPSDAVTEKKAPANKAASAPKNKKADAG